MQLLLATQCAWIWRLVCHLGVAVVLHSSNSSETLKRLPVRAVGAVEHGFIQSGQ